MKNLERSDFSNSPNYKNTCDELGGKFVCTCLCVQPKQNVQLFVFLHWAVSQSQCPWDAQQAVRCGAGSRKGMGFKIQARKKFHPTEQSLFTVRALKCYLNEYQMAKTCSGRVGCSVPGMCPWSWSRREGGRHCQGRAVRCRARTGRRPRSAVCGAAGAPGALLLQSRRKPNKTHRQLLSTNLWDCIEHERGNSHLLCSIYVYFIAGSTTSRIVRGKPGACIDQILSLSRKIQKESYDSSLLLKYLKILISVSLWLLYE